MKSFLMVVAALHAGFMLCELFPWSSPLLLRIVSKNLPEVQKGKEGEKGKKWTEHQQPLVATIVHNAGIYNAILAGGLFWAALPADPVRDVARVLLIGAAVAGIFGTATLRSPLTALQALLGIVGFALV
jgi:putative membrane protein